MRQRQGCRRMDRDRKSSRGHTDVASHVGLGGGKGVGAFGQRRSGGNRPDAAAVHRAGADRSGAIEQRDGRTILAGAGKPPAW